MDPTAAISLGLQALQAVLGLIADIKAQHNLSDDQILAQAKTLTAGNTAAYNALVAALAPKPAA